MNDYLALNQNCIKPLLPSTSANSDATGESAATSKPVTKGRVELDLTGNDARDLRFPGLQATGGAMATIGPAIVSASSSAPVSVSAPGHFDQMKFDPVKKSATVSLNDCLACSGCVTSAETVLITQQSTQEFLNVLAQVQSETSATTQSDGDSNEPASMAAPRKQVLVSISPQSLTALAHEFHLTPLACAKKLTTFFLELGCIGLADTTPALDMALIEAQEEFIQRYRYNQSPVASSSSASSQSSSSSKNTVSPSSSSPLPILASECPGWICYCEKTQTVDTLSHVSSVRSGQAIMGALLKHWWCTQVRAIRPEELFHTTVMPCYDKKLEGSRDDFYIRQFETRETDCVLTTGEVADLIRERGVNLTELKETPLDTNFWHVNQDQTVLYRSIDVGGSGGYAELLYRYAAKRLFGRVIPADEPLPYQSGRNPDFRELTLTVDGKNVLNFALAYGFRNIQNLVRKMKTKKAGKITLPSTSVQLDELNGTHTPTSSDVSGTVSLPFGTGGYHFVEVMACPSGCLNGGGQIKAVDIRSQKQLVHDLDDIYHQQRQVCHPEENPIVKRLYAEWLQGAAPYTGAARQHLHTQYHAVDKELANPLGIKW